MTNTQSPISTRLTEHFDIEYPIICAPMFLVSTVKLVVATCKAGGLGTFPAMNYRPMEKYREAIREIKAQTDKPFGINIIVQASNKYKDDQINIALEEKVPLLITSLGKPADVIKRAHAAGTKVYCDVINIEHARKVVEMGADGLIAVSSGAGGHAGDITPFSLLPALKAAFDVPVIASGSIADGKGMAAAFSLGAEGIYMGTRFIASTEADVDDAYKNEIVKAGFEDIVSTDRVDGFPGNFIYNDALKRVGLKKGFIESLISRNRRVKKWIALSRAARSLFANHTSKVSYKTVFSAGHGVELIKEVKSVREIIEDTVSEYRDIRANLP